MYNWNTLNAKVFHKLGFAVPKSLCEAAARAQPMAIEKVLKLLRFRFAELMEHDHAEEVRAFAVWQRQLTLARLTNLNTKQ